jgi:hypothetical protein
MYTLLFWIGIALLGLALYIYPSFTVRHMYESYANAPPSLPIRTQGSTNVAQPPPSVTGPNVPTGPAGTADFGALLGNIESLLKPQIDTPEMESLPSPTALPPVIDVSGATPQPDGAMTKKSLPQTAQDSNVPKKSGALDQGMSFQNMKPSPVIIVNQMPSNSSYNNASEQSGRNNHKCPPMPDMKEYIRRDMIPDQAACPSQTRCPDMRQYIRKDSIPCWACKLK